jgi:hypothetical protein
LVRHNHNQLKVYDGTSFKPTGGAKVQTTQPTSPSAGDLWQDSTNNQLYFYTGSAWLLVGPVYTTGQTLSGWKIETVTASSEQSYLFHVCGQHQSSSGFQRNIHTRCGITFGFSTGHNGFANDSSGLTLNSTAWVLCSRESTQASHLNVSSTSNTSASVIAGGNFLRADASDTTTGALTIDNNSGITIGDGQEFTITASSGDVTLAQTSEDKNLSVTINDGGVTKTPIAITGSTGAIGLTGDVTITGNLNISGELQFISGTSQHTTMLL